MSTRASPYPGLRAFTTNDAPYFFGRRKIVNKLSALITDRDQDAKFALSGVLGESGIGKSSLVQAGLIPALRSDHSGGHDWTIAVARPGTDVLRSIYHALSAAQIAPEPRNLESIYQDAGSLRRLVETAVAHGLKGRLLLVIDQFEEIFRFKGATSIDSVEYERIISERGFAVEAILAACALPDPPLTVLITMRSGYYGECAKHPSFAEALSSSHILLGAMSIEETLEAIVRPAESAGVTVDFDLPKVLIADAGDLDQNLVLMQFTLAQLWRRNDGERLTLEAYRSVGGISEALTQHLEQVLQSFSTLDQLNFRRIWMRLISTEGRMSADERMVFRRIATVEELVTLVGDRANLFSLIAPLLESGVLILSDVASNGIVELAHETLLRSWPRLVPWLDEERKFFAWLKSLQFRLQQWDEFGDDSSLLRGPALIQARVMLQQHRNDIGPREVAFIESGEGLSRDSALNLSKLMGTFGLRGLETKIADRISEHAQKSKEFEALTEEFQALTELIEQRRNDMERIQSELNASSPIVFISYAREDVAQAQRLYDLLRDKGFRPWLDKKNLLPGQTWKREITQGIKNADFVLVCFSRQAVEKRGFFQSEVKQIIETSQEMPLGAVFLVPVKLDDCEIPLELSDRQYVSLFAEDGFDRICEVLITKWKSKTP